MIDQGEPSFECQQMIAWFSGDFAASSHSFFPLIKTLLPCFDLLDIFLIGRG